MKKFLSFLFMAILGGVISLLGYSAFIEKPQVVLTDDMMPIQTFQTNYNSTSHAVSWRVPTLRFKYTL